MNRKSQFLPVLAFSTALIAILTFPAGKLLGENAPNFSWALQASGTKDDSANAVVVDGSGNIYSGGYFNGGSGVGYPLYFGTSGTLNGSGYRDGFITKQNASGVYQWVQKLGGTQNDEVKALCVDSAGNLFAAGYFAQATFGVSGTITLTGTGAAAFIAKLSASTGNFQWVHQLRSAGNQSNNALCVGTDSAGNVYVAGYFIGTASMATATGTATLVSTELGGGTSFFMIKLDTNGNLLWSQVAAGTGNSQINSLCISGTDSVYVAGEFNHSPQFVIASSTTTFTNNSGISQNNTFIAKLNAGNGSFLWAQQVGGDDTVANSAVLSGSSLIVAGNFQNLATFGTSGTLNTTSYYDGFIEKLDSSGNFIWAAQTGFTSDSSLNGLSVDSSGNIYTSGWFVGPVTIGSSNLDSADANNALFIAKQNSSGVFLWGQQAVGSTSSIAAANAVTVSGTNLIVAGGVGGYDLSDTAAFPGANTLTNTSQGYSGFSDLFVAELGLGTSGSSANPYDAWATTNGIVTGPSGDPDHDGIPNLMEYALGLNPNQASRIGLPVRSVASGYLTLTFNRQKIATDITYRVEATNDLTSTWTEIWNSSSVAYGGGSNASESVTVPDTVLMSASPTHRRFLRLKITKP